MTSEQYIAKRHFGRLGKAKVDDSDEDPGSVWSRNNTLPKNVPSIDDKYSSRFVLSLGTKTMTLLVCSQLHKSRSFELKLLATCVLKNFKKIQ